MEKSVGEQTLDMQVTIELSKCNFMLVSYIFHLWSLFEDYCNQNRRKKDWKHEIERKKQHFGFIKIKYNLREK
jgi:hypothetical protein